MQHAFATEPVAFAADDDEPSLEACDEIDAQDGARYCPTRLLRMFTLLMAGHGRSVRSDMMLGDREYAMWQLARGQTADDDELRQVASRLFAYFDDPRGWGAAFRKR